MAKVKISIRLSVRLWAPLPLYKTRNQRHSCHKECAATWQLPYQCSNFTSLELCRGMQPRCGINHSSELETLKMELCLWRLTQVSLFGLLAHFLHPTLLHFHCFTPSDWFTSEMSLSCPLWLLLLFVNLLVFSHPDWVISAALHFFFSLKCQHPSSWIQYSHLAARYFILISYGVFFLYNYTVFSQNLK